LRGEFGVALAGVRRLADARDDPLAHVAAKMQYQIADGIRGRVGAVPELFVGELGQAGLQPFGVLRELAGGVVEEDGVGGHLGVIL